MNRIYQQQLSVINGPQCSRQEYKQFAKDWGFDHITLSPRYPQSNGFIERMIQTTKSTMTKARQAGVDI